jgi:hypothetical protein
LATAEASPPVEVVVLDYNSSDGLEQYVCQFGDVIAYHHYTGREHYHVAHAWNLAVRCSKGEYVVIAGADALFRENYIATVRELIAGGAQWIRGRHYKGIVCVERAEFIAAGGYDERFEFYGGEDKEFEARLRRRNAVFALLPDDLVYTLKTRNEDKIANYRFSLTKHEMMQRGTVIRRANELAGVLVANRDRQWGAW